MYVCAVESLIQEGWRDADRYSSLQHLFLIYWMSNISIPIAKRLGLFFKRSCHPWDVMRALQRKKRRLTCIINELDRLRACCCWWVDMAFDRALLISHLNTTLCCVVDSWSLKWGSKDSKVLIESLSEKYVNEHLKATLCTDFPMLKTKCLSVQ